MEKQLSKKTLNKSFWLWFYGNLTCFSQEHMQTFGYLSAMLPICEELYQNEPDKLARSMKTYTAFFNTEPQIGAVVVGVTAGLEQARANGEPVDDETINGLRAGLMGPLAGIGDSLIVGTVIPNPAGDRVGSGNWRFDHRAIVLCDNLELVRRVGNAVHLFQRLPIGWQKRWKSWLGKKPRRSANQSRLSERWSSVRLRHLGSTSQLPTRCLMAMVKSSLT